MNIITKDGMPKVILLGNGINRAFGSKSWDGLLKGKNKNIKTIRGEL